MTVQHRCQFCDSDYACDTTQEVSEGVYRCECKAKDECPGCSKHGACEDCSRKPATGEHPKAWLCGDCADEWIENHAEVRA
jgi:hypothetical protein